ncbi:hypothetical protein C8F04DRAFT_1160110 [Mycena alexandri]|uniref:HNH nuclease domain-containing protein n=1 Tax=Mycena alexandri TaxID=1745969 RepID=A0AAD6RX69_9AGAR|nr:hypothetical protein C8F04DRAFT_1160110 [Mycena alexandri]
MPPPAFNSMPPPAPPTPPPSLGPPLAFPDRLQIDEDPYLYDAIVLYHPGTKATLATFYLFAMPNSWSPGLPHSVVVDAAQIIAANKPGVLVRVTDDAKVLIAPSLRDVQRLAIVPSNPAEMLLSGRYLYFVQEPNGGGYTNQYHTLKKFAQWTPPRALPAHWILDNRPPENYPIGLSGTAAADYTKFTDGQCLLTGASNRLDSSHLIPKSERDWFEANGILLGSGTRDAISGPTNLISLRADLTGVSFDHGEFVIVPVEGKAVCFFITGNNRDVTKLAHARVVPLPGRIGLLNLYIRFAWNVFKGPEEHKPGDTSDGGSSISYDTSRTPSTAADAPIMHHLDYDEPVAAHMKVADWLHKTADSQLEQPS